MIAAAGRMWLASLEWEAWLVLISWGKSWLKFLCALPFTLQWEEEPHVKRKTWFCLLLSQNQTTGPFTRTGSSSPECQTGISTTYECQGLSMVPFVCKAGALPLTYEYRLFLAATAQIQGWFKYVKGYWNFHYFICMLAWLASANIVSYRHFSSFLYYVCAPNFREWTFKLFLYRMS